MIAAIGVPVWGVCAVLVLQVIGALSELGALVMVLTGLAAVAGIFLTPLLMRRFARNHLPPDEVRWGMFRNAWRLSPLLLLVLLLSYAVSVASAAVLITVAAVLAICASGR